MAQAIKDNGCTASLMAMDDSFTQTEIHMRESLKTGVQMATEILFKIKAVFRESS